MDDRNGTLNVLSTASTVRGFLSRKPVPWRFTLHDLLKDMSQENIRVDLHAVKSFLSNECNPKVEREKIVRLHSADGEPIYELFRIVTEFKRMSKPQRSIAKEAAKTPLHEQALSLAVGLEDLILRLKTDNPLETVSTDALLAELSRRTKGK